MPYQNEFADKTSHIDIIQNPDIAEFLSRCHKVDDSQEDGIKNVGDLFVKPQNNSFTKPQNIISIDGSYYEASVKEEFPSKKVGFIKVGVVLLKSDTLVSINETSNFVDPFEVAKFKENNDAYSVVLPSTNIVYDDCEDVQESFRKALDDQFDKLRDNKEDSNTSLKTTLFKLASYLDGCDEAKIQLAKCPYCGLTENIYVKKAEISPRCPHCGKRIYATDILRVWEQVEGMTSNQSSLSRTMNVVERLLAMHYIRTIVDSMKESFSNTLENICFFIDGPLAIFGEPAKFHSCIMKYLDDINQSMRKYGKSDVLMIGIQKSGAINDFLMMIKDRISNGDVYCLTDEFRNKYINFDKKPAGKTFGLETYFGQDFLYKNKKGSTFVFNIPYPFREKGGNFKDEKSNVKNYKNLKLYTDLLDEFDCDLYENSLVPTVLAHKYTAISLAPGSKVLDLLSKSKIV